MNCRKCAELLADGFLFCSMCGESAALMDPNVETAQDYCFRCGTRLRDHKKFCFACGADIQSQRDSIEESRFAWLKRLLRSRKLQALLIGGLLAVVMVPLGYLLAPLIWEEEERLLRRGEEQVYYLVRSVREGTEPMEMEDNGGLAADAKGNLYISDTEGHRVLRVDAQGAVTTYAGTGTPGFSGDQGPADEAELQSPAGIAVDEVGNLFIADSLNHRIRRVTPTGRIETIAGTGPTGGGQGGLDGDGGAASVARFNLPTTLIQGPEGNIWVADSGNRRIRKLERRLVGSGPTPGR